MRMKRLYILIFFTLAFFSLKSATLIENFDAAGFSKGTYDVLPAGNAAEDDDVFHAGAFHLHDAFFACGSRALLANQQPFLHRSTIGRRIFFPSLERRRDRRQNDPRRQRIVNRPP